LEKDLEIQLSKEPRAKPILLFVHGFDVTFEEALAGAARLALGLQMQVTPVSYSWASAASLFSYMHDEDTVRASTVNFTAFLKRLLTTQKRPVVIVGHSMGTRLVTAALGELARRHCSCEALSKVVLAAPDLNTVEMEKEWPFLQKLGTRKWTVYASSNDVALKLSHIIHHYQRVGDSKPTFFIDNGLDTIDASSTASSLSAWGHSYVTESPVVAADIGAWIANGSPPVDRGLAIKTQNDQIFYRFP
jgi:esterase/lipase superfamily enzyme